MNKKSTILRVVPPCSQAQVISAFVGSNCLHIQDRRVNWRKLHSSSFVLLAVFLFFALSQSLKMEAVPSYETLLNLYEITRRETPEGSTLKMS